MPSMSFEVETTLAAVPASSVKQSILLFNKDIASCCSCFEKGCSIVLDQKELV